MIFSRSVPSHIPRSIYLPIQADKDELFQAGKNTHREDYEEKIFADDRRSHRQRQSWFKVSVLFINSTILVLLILLYIGASIGPNNYSWFLSDTIPEGAYYFPTPQKYERLSSTNVFVPVYQVPLEDTTFNQDPVYTGWPTPARNEAWKVLQGPDNAKQGFITLKNEVYEVTMYHQLHCLGMVRKMVWDVVLGHIDTKELVGSSKPNMTSDTNYASTVDSRLQHVDHCLDFVRQGLQCAGNIGLEPAVLDGNGMAIGALFGHAKHQCRSWDLFWKFAENH